MDRRETGSETRGVTSPGDSQRQLQAGLESVQQLLSLATQQQGTAHTTLERLEVTSTTHEGGEMCVRESRCVYKRARRGQKNRFVNRNLSAISEIISVSK